MPVQEEGQKLQQLARSSEQQPEPGGQERERESQEATQDKDEKMAKTRDSLVSIHERVQNVKGSTIATPRQFSYEWKQGALYELIKGRFYFAAHPDDEYTLAAIRQFPERFYFSNHLPDKYERYCQDFGPTNIALVIRFCREIDAKLQDPRLKDRPVVFYCQTGDNIFTNSILMLAAYLLLVKGHTVERALLPFAIIHRLPILGYLDATWFEPTFTLHLEWCIRGLARAKKLGWINADTYDIDDYSRLDHPHFLGANHINPKFIAFPGPVTRRPGMKWHETKHEPEEYLEEFRRRGVSTVVRLNEPTAYDKKVFERAGIQVVDLEFADCTTPSAAIIKRFLDVVDGAKGVVAIHCLAGLGRTGTLIAIHMMKHNGFSGLEAMGLVRLMRPGSIIGPQQEFLESMDNAIWGGNFVLSGVDFASVDKDRADVMACQVAKAAGRWTAKPRGELHAQVQTTPGGLQANSLGASSSSRSSCDF